MSEPSMLSRTEISRFIDDIAAVAPKGNLFNMYRDIRNDDSPMAPHTRRNLLRDKLARVVGSDYALIGLAPGYAGARVSGLPFMDESQTGTRISTRYEPWKEQTASVIERACRVLGIEPAMWNAIPFHPHEEGRPYSNRTPTAAEFEKYGYPWLARFLELIRPGIVIPVGRAAERALMLTTIPDGIQVAPYVRHPSYGGETMFFKGMGNIVGAFSGERRS